MGDPALWVPRSEGSGGHRVTSPLFHNSSRMLPVREGDLAAMTPTDSSSHLVGPMLFSQNLQPQPVLEKTLRSQPTGKVVCTAA